MKVGGAHFIFVWCRHFRGLAGTSYKTLRSVNEACVWHHCQRGPFCFAGCGVAFEEISMAIWRIETCKAEAGYRSNASIYNLIREGLWTKPVLIGQRSVGWPDDEVRALCAARIAGKTDDEIRELVSRLHLKRTELLAAI